MSRIYLDHNASSPLRPCVKQALKDALENCGNPSSLHQEGQANRFMMDKARRQVAETINVRPEQVVFTSGGTEANNMALRGVMRSRKGRLLTTKVEHDCVLNTAKDLQDEGYAVTFLTVDNHGRVDLEALEQELAKGDVALVSVMSANNETGVWNDVQKIAALCHEAGALCHTDAVQMLGHKRLDFVAKGVDMMTLSFHKIGAPKGIGALVLKNELAFSPLITGGAHERKRRAGTENLLGIVGAGAACNAMSLEKEVTFYKQATARLMDGVHAQVGAKIVAEEAKRLPHVMTLVCAGVKAEDLLIGLDMAGIAVSQGAACSSGKAEASHVLQAMGLSDTEAASGIRISFGWSNTLSDADRFVEAYAKVLNGLRH